MTDVGRGRWRRWLPNLALATASLLASALAAELAIRLVRPQPVEVIVPGLYQPDPPRRYQLSPGYRGELTNFTEIHTTLAISSQGLRDDELAAKGAGEKRLLVLGDSFVFGWGVEQDQTLAARLEALLAPEHPRWRVINAGIPGFGVPDEVDWLEAHGLALEPDAIAVTVFLGNDLLDATQAYRRVELVDGLVAETGANRGLRFQLYRHSHLVRLLKQAIPLGLQTRLRRLIGLPQPWSSTLLRQGLEAYATPPSPLQQEGREATRAALEHLAQLAREHGLHLALVLVPDHRDVEPERWAATLASLELDPARYRPGQPVHVFSELAAELGMPVLDLSPAFRTGLAGGERLYFEHDPHWTVAGNARAARELYPFVLGSGLLAASPGDPL